MENPDAPSPEFLSAFRAHADASGAMPFGKFMELALYGEGVGYYRRDVARVGRSRDTDFYTATSQGPLFGELIAAACAGLLGLRHPSDVTFVEIGAEPGSGGVLAGVPHPFRDARTVSLGEPLKLEGTCVVFSNELFDAQPCRRFIRRQDGWRERAVSAASDGSLKEIDGAPADVAAAHRLPEHAPEGWIFDAPLAAVSLLESIARQPWKGVFIACDYGRSWESLAHESPQGTLRAYRRHRQSNDLLASPGRQDLTCHVCWDWLQDALADHGFAEPCVESQEAFFIHQAAPAIEAVFQTETATVSSKKLALMQLLHPGNMGQKFQVLHAKR